MTSKRESLLIPLPTTLPCPERHCREAPRLPLRSSRGLTRFSVSLRCVDDLLYNRSLVGDACLMWVNKTVIHAFRSLDDHAQAQIHYRVTVANFRRRYELRTVMPMIRGWHEWTHEKSGRRRIAAKAAFKLYSKMIAQCLEIWMGIIRDRRLAEREMAAKGSKTLMRIAKRPMVVSFERWKNYSAEQKRHRQIVARISYRWRNANVVLTFR